jgi:hypothetical protein
MKSATVTSILFDPPCVSVRHRSAPIRVTVIAGGLIAALMVGCKRAPDPCETARVHAATSWTRYLAELLSRVHEARTARDRLAEQMAEGGSRVRELQAQWQSTQAQAEQLQLSYARTPDDPALRTAAEQMQQVLETQRSALEIAEQTARPTTEAFMQAQRTLRQLEVQLEQAQSARDAVTNAPSRALQTARNVQPDAQSRRLTAAVEASEQLEQRCRQKEQ